MNIEEYKALKEQDTQPTEVKEEPVQTEVKTVVDEPIVEKPITVEIDGKEVTIDELSKGYLRQSDYTKKTTDVSNQKKELADAKALYDMVQSNPTLRKQLESAGGNENILEKTSGEHRRIATLESELANMKLDTVLSDLQNKYPDFNETKVINEAAKRGITDLEFIYKALRDDNGPLVDKDALRAELKAELQTELGLSKAKVPPTIMNGKKSGGAPTANADAPNITASEKRMAKSFGMTIEEYIRNRDV